MNELERMKALKELLNEDEVIEFNNCLEVLNQTFKQMLGKVKEKVLESNESNVGINSTTELFEAIQKISSLADKYGINSLALLFQFRPCMALMQLEYLHFHLHLHYSPRKQ